MDAVITYVDGRDPLWQQDYERTVGKSVIAKRYRDWGTLRYLLRGIEKNLPFIDNVYLVVARGSQVPAWADTSCLKVATHDMIIPENSLPTFNSSMIEMFLHRIPTLSERYLYFNDDMFPVRPCTEDVFFKDGKAVMGYAVEFQSFIEFKKLCRHSDSLARKAAGRIPSPWFLRPQHTCSPFLKSACDVLFSKLEQEIMASLSPLRSNINYNQYLFLDYMLYTGKAVRKRLPAKYFSLGFSGVDKILSFLKDPGDRKLVCINDAKIPEESYDVYRKLISETFESMFPDKSRFEL